MASSTHLPHENSSQRFPSGSSEKRWKEYFHTKLMETRKRPQSSNSLFWDWSKDVKDSIHSREKNP